MDVDGKKRENHRQEIVLGVISDTHGLLRPGLFKIFSEVDAILHAGDIGDETILSDLATVAPVYAVSGNTDRFPIVEQLPEQQLLQFGSVTLFMTHIGGSPEFFSRQHPESREAQLVIFGHSHRPLQQQYGERLFFNPGSAGPRRFNLPVTAGRIEISSAKIGSRILEVPDVYPPDRLNR